MCPASDSSARLPVSHPATTSTTMKPEVNARAIASRRVGVASDACACPS
jgi:hypothetical protein